MAKLKIPETAGFNAGKSYYAKPFRVEDIVIKDGNMSVKKGYSEHKKRTKPQTDIAGERLLGKHWLFLKDAVTLLVEANKADAAELLVGHFIDQDEKNSFYELLPDGIREHFIKSVSLPDQSQ